MDPLTMSIVAGANIAGGLIGGAQASAEAKKAQALLDAAIQRIDGLQIPDLTKDIIYQQFMAVGDFTPQNLDNLIDKFAPVALITENPENKLRQLGTYNQIKQTSLTGLSPQDKLAMEQAKRNASRDVLAQMASIESQAKQRGQFGGGAQLASQLQSVQSSADREAMENMQAAANASQNRMAALSKMGDLENYLRSADLNVEEKNVAARNAQEEFKNRYMVQRAGDVWQNKNLLAQQQREAQQLASNKNIEQANKEAYRKGFEAPLEMFKAKMDKEKAMANLMGGKADVHMGLGGAKAKSWSDIGSGVGMAAIAGNFGGGKAAAPVAGSDISIKENIEHIGNDDATGLPIYDFNYKGNKDRYRGVMAQDVERVMPEAVSIKDGIKYVDYNKLGMKMFKLT